MKPFLVDYLFIEFKIFQGMDSIALNLAVYKVALSILS